jgi:hypothetical protein
MGKKKAKGKKTVNKQEQAKNILVQQIQTNKRLTEEVQLLQTETDQLETDAYRYSDYEGKVSLIKQEAKKLGKGNVGVKYNQLLDRVLSLHQKLSDMLKPDKEKKKNFVNPVELSEIVEAEINTPEWNYLGDLDPDHMFHRKTYAGGYTIFLHDQDDDDEEIPVDVQASEEMLYDEEGKLMLFANYRSNKLFKELGKLGAVLSRTGSAGAGIIRTNYETAKETLLKRLLDGTSAGGGIAKARQKIEKMEEQIEDNNKGITQFFDDLISPPDSVDRYEIYDKLTGEQKGLALSAETKEKIQAIQDVVISRATDLHEQQQAEGVKQELAEQAAAAEQAEAEQAAAQAEQYRIAEQAEAEAAAQEELTKIQSQKQERQQQLEDTETKISSMDIQRVKSGGRPITEGTRRPAKSGGKAAARREAYRTRMNFNIYGDALVDRRIRRASAGGGGGDDDDDDDDDRPKDDSDKPKKSSAAITKKEIIKAKTKAYLDYYNEMGDLSATQQGREKATNLRKKNRLKNLYEKLAYGLGKETPIQQQGVYNAIKSIVLGDTDLKNLQEEVEVDGEEQLQDKPLDTSRKTVEGKNFVGSFIGRGEQARTYLREPDRELDLQRGKDHTKEGSLVSFREGAITRTQFKGGDIPQTTKERSDRFFKHTIRTAKRVKRVREKVKGELKGNLAKLTAERENREGRADFLPTVQAERTQTRMAELNRTENVAGGADIINVSGGGEEGGEPADTRPFVVRYAERRAETDIQRIEPKYTNTFGEQTVPSQFLISEKAKIGEQTFPTFSQKIRADFGTTEYNLERKGRLDAKFGEKTEKYIQEWADDATVLKAFKLDPISRAEKIGMSDEDKHELSTQRLAESMMALGDTQSARPSFEGEKENIDEERGTFEEATIAKQIEGAENSPTYVEPRRADIESAARELYAQQLQLKQNFIKFQDVRKALDIYMDGGQPYPYAQPITAATAPAPPPTYFGAEGVADYYTDFIEEKRKAKKLATEGGKKTSLMSDDEIPTPINLITNTNTQTTFAVGYLGKAAVPMSKIGADNGVGDLKAINKFYVGNRVVYWGHTAPLVPATDPTALGGGGAGYLNPVRPLESGAKYSYGYTTFMNILENPLYTDTGLAPVRTQDIPSGIAFQEFKDEGTFPATTQSGDFRIGRGYTDASGNVVPYNPTNFPANPQTSALTTQGIQYKKKKDPRQSYDNYFIDTTTGTKKKLDSVRKATRTTKDPPIETPSDQRARLRRIQRNAMLFHSHNVSTTVQGKF